MASSCGSRKSGDGVLGQFPVGMRVLVVDDDLTCLMILEKMLQSCRYQVTKCNRAKDALTRLRDHKDGYDIVLSDVHMPDMDGFNLLKHVGLEMELPVIMMSADDSKDVVMKGVTHGACDYLIKPIRMEELKNIWQHVVRKKKQGSKDHSGSEDGDRVQKQSEDVDNTSPASEGQWKSGSRKRKEEEDDEDEEERDDTSSLKKPRVVWTQELHLQFVNAVNQLGIDKAVPKKILELMSVPGLTRENVASHLQKYRIYLRKLNISQRTGIGNPLDSPFVTLHGLEYPTFSQLSPQNDAATFQNSTLNKANNRSGMDQRAFFSFENPFFNAQPLSDSNKRQPTNLLHGIPTNMGSRQLPALHHQTEQPFINMNMSMLIPSNSASQSSFLMPQQMVQQQMRTQPRPIVNNSLNPLTSAILPAAATAAGDASVQGGFGQAHLQNFASSVPQHLAFSSRNTCVPSSVAPVEEFKSESRGNTAPRYEDSLNRVPPQQQAAAVCPDTNNSLVVPTSTGDTSGSSRNIGEGGLHSYFFNDQFESEDVLSTILRQSETILGVEHDYSNSSLEGFSVGNLPP